VEEVWLVGQELYYVLMEFLPLFGTRYLPCFPYLYMNINFQCYAHLSEFKVIVHINKRGGVV
jgi:hypothetical protein